MQNALLNTPTLAVVQQRLNQSPPTVSKRVQNAEQMDLEEFRRGIDKHMKIGVRSTEVLRLIDDAETAQAARTDEEMDRKRRYGDAQSKAQFETVKRACLGGKVTEQDARIVQTTRAELQQSVAHIQQVYGSVTDSEHSKQLTRAICDTIGVSKVAQYTETEYNQCIVDAVKGARGNQKELSEKYGLSVATIKRGITHVYKFIEREVKHPDRKKTKELARKISDDDILKILGYLRSTNVIAPVGAKPALTDAELKYVMGTFGALGNTGLDQNKSTVAASVARGLNKMGKSMEKAIVFVPNS